MNANPFRRCFSSIFFAALFLTPLLASGAPVSMDFKVLIDSDNRETTGCTVVTTAGLVKGVDHVLTTSVSYDSAAGTAAVTGVTRQTCTDSVANTFSSAIPVDSTGWPVGVGAGGNLLIETHIPMTALGGVTNMHLAFTAVSGTLVDGVVADNDGDKIIWPPLPGMRRHAAGLATTRVITLDGADGDWNGIVPIVEGSSSASPGLRFLNVRTYMNESDLFFAVAAQADKNAPTANDDAYSVERGQSLGIGVPGVLSNDTDPNFKSLIAILVAGTQHGALTLNADGSFSYQNDGSNAPSDSFEYKANNGTANSNTAQVNITITEPSGNPTPPPAPKFTSANKTTFTVGTFGTFTFTTTPTNPKPTVSLTSGTLPTGVNFSAIANTGTGKISGVPANGTAGVYTLHLKADNHVPPPATQTFTLTVCNVINVGNPATTTATANAAFSQSFTQTGAVGTATFSLNSGTLPAGLTLSGAGVLSGTPTVVGTFPITVKVTDANGCSGVGGTYNLTVNCQTITVNNPATNTGTVNAAFSQTFTASNTIGAVTFSTASTLPAGLTLSSAGVLSGTPTQTGTFPIVVTATDGNGCSGSGATYNLTINCQTISVTNPATNTGTVDAAFSQTFTASNTVGAVTFSTASALPAGLTLSSGGVLSGTPTVTGTFPIVVTATDANGCSGSGATYNLTINCQTISVTNPATNTGTVDAAFSQTFTQTGAHGSATFSTASALPAGLTLSTGGVLSGTPTVTGTFPIVVTVTDANGCTGTGATYNLTINCQAITVNNPANASGTVDAAFSEAFTQTGAHGTATFTTASTLPAGLTLSTAGVLSGTPTVNGTFPIVVVVTDANGCTGTGATYNLVIACQTITVTNPANASGTVDAAFSETFTQTGAHGTATFTTSSTLPAGLTLSTAGVLSGTPTVNGTFPIVVVVTDANGCTGTGATYNLVIACQTINVTNPANASGTVDAAFSETFTQTGAHGTATFSLASGALPAGLTLSTAGVLSGTPTVPGNFPITVMVTDSNGCTGTGATYNLVIACQTINVTNPANASGTVDAAFSETFTQTGAHGTATFSTASTLPAGLTLSTAGVLSGTPTVTGTFPIVVTVTDSNGCTGTGATYNLVIGCQTITVTNPANASGTVNAAFSEQFSQTGAHGTATFTLNSGSLPAGLTLSSSGLLSGTPTVPGSFPITVLVTDANGCTGVGPTYTIVIACQTITVTNPATSSFPAGSPMSVTFTQTGGVGTTTFSESGALPTGLTFHTATGVLDGTPMQGGTFPIVVTATDSNGCQGAGATYNLVITCPTITVTNPANTQGTAGVAFSETFSQSGGVGTITWSESGTLPTGFLFNTSTGVLSGTTNQVGAFPITVTATDQNGCQGTGAQYNLTINCQTITVTNPGNATGTVDAAFSETFNSGGILGTVTYSLASGTLPAGLTLNPSTGVLDGTPTEKGPFSIVVRATDTNGCFGDGATYNLTIVCQTITVTNPATTTGTVDAPFSQTFTQSGAHGTATFTTSSLLPAGLTLSTAGVLAGTPTVPGNFPIVVVVTDSNGCTGTGATYNLTINCQTITVTNPVTNSGTVGTFFSQTFTQTGGHGTTTFSLQSGTLPTGFTLSSGGVLSGTTNQFGTFPIVVRATDSNGCFGDGSTYNLTINCQTITVANPANTSGTVNAAFSEQFTQTGGIGGGNFSTVSTLPNGLLLSTAGLLSGTPTQSGTFNIIVSFTDGNGCGGSGPTYQLIIACQTISVTNPANSTGTAGSPFSEQFSQTGAVGTVTWSVTGTLPTGITIDGSTGILSGTTSQTGIFPITVTATDQAPNNACSGTGATYNLTINCQTISITNPLQNSVQAGTTLSPASDWTFSATGILGTATWNVQSGTLPSGITLGSGTGILTGSSTAQGTYPLTIRVTDTNGCFADSAYTLTITCPTITPARTGGGAFPAGTFNTAYAGQSFTASGGTGPYTFVVTSGTFPPGLTLASGGGISGTPTATGTFVFDVTATDTATSCTGFASFSIAINPAATGDAYSNLVNNTEAVVTGFATPPTTPFVALTGTIIANDLPSGGVAATATTVSTTQGGSVTIAADGTFKYTPPVTVSALSSDTFNYTITSNTGGTGTPTQATGTVTLNLVNRVWYVKNNGAAGNGQSQSPFNTLAAAQTASTASDIIFVYNGDGLTTGQSLGITLKANQQLIGEGVALVVNGNTLVVAGTKPQITNTAATSDVVTLNDGNTVKGMTITGTAGARDGISSVSAHVGFTADTITVQNNVNVGVDLINMTGTITITNSTISTVGNQALTINGGTAAVTVDNTNTLAGGTGTAVSVLNRPAAAGAIAIGATITGGQIQLLSNTSGTISFTGSQTLSNTTVNGVTMTTNAGATITFSGTLNVTTTTGIPFQASGGGTLNVSGTANLTSGAAANGLSLNTITVGGSGVAFSSVSTTGATTGIALTNVTGTVSVNGGTLTNGGTGVSLQGASTNLSLAGVTITGPTTGITNTTNFGTLTIGASVNVSAATALNLTTGAISGTFANVSSTGGTNGVNLNAITGTWGATAGSLTGATGSTFNVTGGSGGTISWGTTINQANAANVVTISGSNSNTINFSGNVTTSGTSTGVNISASSGTYNFTGGASTLTGTGAGITIVNESGTISFGSGYSINGPTTSFKIGGTATNTTANITYSGTITNNVNNGVLLDINSAAGTYSTGTITFNGTSLSGNSTSVVSVIKNMTGTLAVNNMSLTGTAAAPGTLVAISGTNTAGSFTFNHLTLSAPTAGNTGNGLTMAAGSGGTLAITATGGNSSISVGSSALSLDGTGNAITLNASALQTVTSLGNGTASAILLNNVTGGGTLSITGGSLTGVAGAGTFVVSAGSPSVTYGGTITQNAANRLVSIANTTAGAISFTDAATGLTAGSTSTGININTANSNITFTKLTLGTSGARMTNQAVTIANGGSGFTYALGTISVFTTGAKGIGATNFDGTLTVTGGTVDSSTATAIDIDGPVGLTTLGISLTSVTSAGGTADGISIQDTNGSFTVNGDGANTSVGGNSTGGTISGKSGADLNVTQGIGVYLNNVTTITLRRLTINGTNQNYGIKGLAVNGFTLEYSTVGGTNGTVAALAAPENAGEGSIYFGNASNNGLTGTAVFTNNNISGGRGRNLSVINAGASHTTTLTVKGSTFGAIQNFADGGASFAVFEASSGSTLNATFGGTLASDANTLTSAVGDLVNFSGGTGTTMDVQIRRNALSDNHAFNNSGGGGMWLQTSGSMTFVVDNNTMRDANASALTLFKATVGTLLSGQVTNNTIGVSGTADSGSKTGNGIFVSAGGSGTISFTIKNNQIHQIKGNSHIYADNTGGSYAANFTIEGNTLDTWQATNFAGIAITNGSPGSGDTINVCAKIGGATAAEKNTLNLGASNLGIIVGSSGAAAGHTFNLPGFSPPGGTPNAANVKAFLSGNNSGTFQSDAYADAPATFNAFTGTGTGCPTP